MKLLLPILLVLLAPYCNKIEPAPSNSSTYDLRPVLESEGVLSLQGKARFYPRRFLESHASSVSEQSHQNSSYSLVSVPGPWDQYRTEPGTFGPTGYGTFEMTVLVPKREERLALKVRDIGTAYRIYANGEFLGSMGEPATEATEHKPAVGEAIYHFKSEGSPVVIRVEVSNFSYRKGGLWEPILVGGEGAVHRENWKEGSVQILLMGILLIMGLYHSGFFLIRKQETSLFFFGLSCFLIAIREMTLGPRLLNLLLPEAGWANVLRLEYTCFFMALPAFAFYMNSLFHSYFRRWVAYLFLSASLIFSLLTWFSEPIFFTQLAPHFQYIMLGFIIYGMIALVRAVRWAEPGARALLLSAAILALSAINDALLVRHFYDGPRVIALGQIQFVVAQAFMLAVRFSQSMKKVETYNRIIQQRNESLRQQKSNLELRAAYDDLTGLGNRTLLMDTLEKEMLQDSAAPFSLVLLDVDDFRMINEAAGHVVGDAILVEISRRLKYMIPSRDKLFRLDGDEFAIIHTGIQSSHETHQFSSRIRSIFSDSVEIGDRSFQTTVSVGFAHFPENGQTPLMLFRSADSAVIQAKDQGKNREQEFDSSRDMEHQIRLDLSERLEQAIRRNELELYFQPIVDLTGGRVVGAEALLRWNEPELGFVAPDIFIPIAEETGQIRYIGEMVVRQSVQQLALWNRIIPDFSISVNISPGQLSKTKLVESLGSLISEFQVDPHNLKLEITENMLLEDKNVQILHNVRGMGVRLVMDDFGTGYSSFAYLQKFLFDVLKIDKSFLLNLNEDSSNPHLVQAMVQMAHSLKMQVVAEGIETEDIASFMKSLGCEMGQGYLYDRALSTTDFESNYINRGGRPVSPSIA